MALAPVNGKDSTTSGTNKKPTGEAQSTSLARRGPPREGRGWANVCARGGLCAYFTGGVLGVACPRFGGEADFRFNLK